MRAGLKQNNRTLQVYLDGCRRIASKRGYALLTTTPEPRFDVPGAARRCLAAASCDRGKPRVPPSWPHSQNPVKQNLPRRALLTNPARARPGAAAWGRARAALTRATRLAACTLRLWASAAHVGPRSAREASKHSRGLQRQSAFCFGLFVTAAQWVRAAAGSALRCARRGAARCQVAHASGGGAPACGRARFDWGSRAPACGRGRFDWARGGGSRPGPA